jgi:predicted nucleotidyltransferase
MITVNLDKAKDITKDRLRAERKPLLEAQDVEFQKALETGADTTAIVAEKERLRGITDQVNSMTTVDELKTASIG